MDKFRKLIALNDDEFRLNVGDFLITLGLSLKDPACTDTMKQNVKALQTKLQDGFAKFVNGVDTASEAPSVIATIHQKMTDELQKNLQEALQKITGKEVPTTSSELTILNDFVKDAVNQFNKQSQELQKAPLTYRNFYGRHQSATYFALRSIPIEKWQQAFAEAGFTMTNLELTVSADCDEVIQVTIMKS